MQSAANQQSLAGWGRYPVEPAARVFRPAWRADLTALLANEAHLVPRGLGRSYGDAALGPGVLDLTGLGRFLAFDEASGELHAEGGASFAEIAATFLPRGWFLPVTPGTKFVTLGGAIAHDVHGKNHHRDGSLAAHVTEFELLTPAHGLLRCSREENAPVFWATLGGAGLTGVVTSAKLRLARVETAHVQVDYHRARHLDEAIALFEAHDAGYQFSVAWIDCLARGSSLGRSVLMLGNPAPRSALKPGRPPLPPLATQPRLGLPMDFPPGLLNPWSVRAFNALFYARHPDRRGCLVGFEPYFYPLDAIGHWNRMYGRGGFVQYQVALPTETARDGLAALLDRLSGAGSASFLAVLKRFGPASGGLLSFPIAGYTLALDLPAGPGMPALIAELDRLTLAHGGRIYLAKDALADAATFARMYPTLTAFKAIRRDLDPRGVLASRLARRLELL